MARGSPGVLPLQIWPMVEWAGARLGLGSRERVRGVLAGEQHDKAELNTP